MYHFNYMLLAWMTSTLMCCF